MQPEVYYSTVSEAIALLRNDGYSLDFNLEENAISCNHGQFTSEEFEITKIYRYEGNTDPADEATVYGIESKSGLKGVLVTGYGANGENSSSALLDKFNKQKK